MMTLTRLSIQRPIAVIVFALLVSILGTVAWNQLPLELLPDLKRPTVLVSISSGDRPAVHMERWYGERLERRLFTIPGLQTIDQVAYSGRLVSRLSFSRETDVDLMLVEVNRALASLAAEPLVDEVRIRRDDVGQGPVMVLGMTSEPFELGLTELSSLARRQLARNLEQLEGVAEVRVSGGREREVQVEIKTGRLRAYGLNISDVVSRIGRSNIDVDVGTLEDESELLLVRADSRFDTLKDIEDLVVTYYRSAHGVTTAVRVADVATVSMGRSEITNMVRVNGQEGVGLFVYKSADANTVTVSRVLRQAIGRLTDDLPGIEFEVISDNAVQIESAIKDVQQAALLGVALAILVLAVFLRSIGPIIAVVVAVPVSLLATTFAMDLAGQTLNLMSLAGLALGAGMLVDNSIVVVESIFRRRAAGDSPVSAATNGAILVSGAIVTSTLTTCVVFLPGLFIDGLASQFLAGISFTVVVSLIASLFVAVFLIPALAVGLMPKGSVHAIDPGADRIERMAYRTLNSPLSVLLVTAVLFSMSVFGLRSLGTQLLPPANPDHFSLRVTAPAGQRVESTQNTVDNIEQILSQAAGDGLASMLSEVGQVDEDDRVIQEQFVGENTAQVRVRLDTEIITANRVVDASIAAIGGLYGAQVDWKLNGTALSQAIDTNDPGVVVVIQGESLDGLRAAATNIAEVFSTSDAFWDVRSSFEGAPDEIHVTLKQEFADGLGINFDTIRPVLEASLDGVKTTEIVQGDETHDVLIALPRASIDSLSDLKFQGPNGQMFTIGEVAKLSIVPAARKILRRDQHRIAEVTAILNTEYAAPEARAIAEEKLSQVSLPPDVRAYIAGEEQVRVEALSELGWAGLLALMLVFMVLAASFESILHPLTILSAIPVSVIGIAVVMFPLGEPLGVMAALGFVVLVGIVVNDAILLIKTARRLIEEGEERQRALARATALRFRPIMMTTATTVLALLPLALFHGEAAQVRSPLAWTVIGGMIASTIGCLAVIPSVYLTLDKIGVALVRLMTSSVEHYPQEQVES